MFKSFLLSRWRGEAPLETVFLRDMLLVGTGLTIAAAVAAHAMRDAGMAEALAVAVSMLPVPWNMFLFYAVWRCSERDGGPGGLAARVIAVMWLITMFVI